jgi:BNR-Asp box repeat
MDSVLYIGTEQGVITARSSDRRSWQIVEHGLKTWEVSDLAVSPGDPNKVFAGTRGDGVWLSEDFGKSWKKPCYGKRGPGKVRSVTIDPHDPRRLYVGCEPIDIFMSDDEGSNWVRFDAIWRLPSVPSMSYPLTRVEPHVRDVAVDPTDPNVLYAALQLGYIIKSDDRGQSWRLLDNGLDRDVHTIVIDPADPRRLVVATGGHDSRLGQASGRALYNSSDSGATWTPTAMSFTQEYSVPLLRDPHHPNRLYSALAHGAQGRWRRRPTGAESVIVRSDDGGGNWERVGAGIAATEFPEALAVDDGGRLYAGCRSGGLYTSDDAGESWQPGAVGMPEITSVACGNV